MSIFHEIQCISVVREASQMVGQAGSRIRIVYADMNLIRSKIKIKVTGLLNFRKLPKIAFF